MLKEFYLRSMEINCLPSDLLCDMTNIEIISFESNQIRHIEKGVFEDMRKLRYVSLAKNPSIDVLYAISYWSNEDLSFSWTAHDEKTTRVYYLAAFNAIIDNIYGHSQIAKTLTSD